MMNASQYQRRQFLQNMGLGFGAVAASAVVTPQAMVSGAEPSETATAMAAMSAAVQAKAPKAKSVIWLFMIGGVSHMESFDPKPLLTKYSGKSINETPHAAVLDSPFLANERVVSFDPNNGFIRNECYPLQVGFQHRGKSGLEISDWFPHLGDCADDLCLIRSMWTEDSNHGAQLQFHTGRHRVDGFFPTVGAWANYGLGSLNDNLPQFVVMGQPVADCCGGRECHRANYLGPRYDGIPLAIDPAAPLPYAKPVGGVYREEQEKQFELLGQLHAMTAAEHPNDAALEARIESYELAFRMQAAVPDVVRFDDESQATRDLYGLDNAETKEFAMQMLTARRLVERGVRFIQVYHGSNGGAGQWDSHKGLKKNHARLARQTDQPIAALLKDLKQRGLLDETLVVWATEFGRTPGSQHGDGRDHHPYGFSVWMAGGGIRGGMTHGATDELGFHAVQNRHYVSDIHATVLTQLGLDPKSLVVPGRKRLEKEIGTAIQDVIA